MAKQAKILSKVQEKMVLSHLRNETKLSHKNVVSFLLSTRAMMRSAEIAGLKWENILVKNGEDWVVGNELRLPDEICKGSDSRTIPINKELKASLEDLWEIRKDVIVDHSWNVIYTIHHHRTTPNSLVQWFRTLYKKLGMDNYSSHSGRRSGITHLCRNLHKVEDSSLRDVMEISGHKQLKTLQLYIAKNPKAQKSMVELL